MSSFKSLSEKGMLWKVAVALVFATILAVTLVGCGSSDSSTKKASDNSNNPTESVPIVTDTSKKEVKYLAQVNGTYFTQGTSHGIAYKGGTEGGKAILTGLGDEKDLYQSLVDCGFNAGNNLTEADMNVTTGDGKTIEGDQLEITIEWDGQIGRAHV